MNQCFILNSRPWCKLYGALGLPFGLNPPVCLFLEGSVGNQEGKECCLESSSLDIHILRDIASSYSQQLRNSHFPCVNAAVGIFQIVHSVIALWYERYHPSTEKQELLNRKSQYSQAYRYRSLSEMQNTTSARSRKTLQEGRVALYRRLIQTETPLLYFSTNTAAPSAHGVQDLHFCID